MHGLANNFYGLVNKTWLRVFKMVYYINHDLLKLIMHYLANKLSLRAHTPHASSPLVHSPSVLSLDQRIDPNYIPTCFPLLGSGSIFYESYNDIVMDMDYTYSSFLLCVEQSSSADRVSDVEGMIIASIGRVIPSIDKELVVASSLHHQLWDDGVINVPGDTPARSTYTALIIVIITM